MIKKINIGVIGLGFGETHLKSYNRIKKCKIFKICDFIENKRIFEKKYKTKFTNNASNIIYDKKIDVVSIASYDNFHAKMLIDSIEQNKHVFVEKPLCTNFSDLKKIKKVLDKNKNKKILTNMVLRNHPKFLKVKKLISSGKIGKIYHIEGEYNYGRFHKLTNGWRGDLKNYSVSLGGGIHIIDLFLWLVKSKVSKVVAIGNKLRSKGTKFKNNDTVTSLLKFKNDVTGKITSNFSIIANHHHNLNIFGDKGTIIVTKNNIKICTKKKKNLIERNEIFKNNKNYKSGLIKNFVSSIFKRRKISISKDMILHTNHIGLSIDKSLKTMRWEKINY